MKQKIKGYHQDEIGDWVAELECNHGQHIRHNLPMVNRPWVLTSAGRQTFIGVQLNCKKCDENAPPDF